MLSHLLQLYEILKFQKKKKSDLNYSFAQMIDYGYRVFFLN